MNKSGASFINKSVNYSETILLKSQLAKLLTMYNTFIAENLLKASPFEQNNYHIIPNNGMKYYMYITSKRQLEQCKEDYNILYLFPDDATSAHTHQPIHTNQTIHATENSDYYLEINNQFQMNVLLEGYLYVESQQSYNFLLTDILFYEDQIIRGDYSFRYNILNELVYNRNLSHLNNHLNIKIHPVFHSDNENIIKIFTNNFVYKNQIACLENVYTYKKIQTIKPISPTQSTQIKIITKTKYTDVYNVQNEMTQNLEGVLYVKGIAESKKLKHLFEQSKNCVQLTCSYNPKFHKWQPIF